MVKNIVRDRLLLAIKSVDATIDDLYLANDLIDTLKFNRSRCVGMAANMIGVSKKVIIFEDENKNYVVMFNPIIIKKEMEYETEEGCLSLEGVRPTKRYKKIKVEYLDFEFRKRNKSYSGFTAQIIQHEMDHLEGIII
ncbi:MAG: peptide deformylase [Erysipelotrichaceae bacterium]|nr:peptide deformylase [Erysipelotrichaceae bacterium]